jgi:hypothetical protein
LKNKLAIIGCATETRDNVDYSDPDLDIWVFNESAVKDWCKRADAVFQLHQEEVWKSPVNRGDAEHGKWLMSGNTPTIYMLEKYPEVPKAVKYPMDEIVTALLPNFTVDSERARKDFFTSTISYSYALGIYLGYKEIHTYGVELADESEYREQQPCAMFWNGIAVGRGIKWVSHSKMFDAPLYPLETFVGLDKQVFIDQIAKLKPLSELAQNDYVKVKEKALGSIKHYEDTGNGKEEMEKAIQEQAASGQKFGILDGAIQENDRYLQRANAMEKATTTYVFSRHEFARDRDAIGVRRQNTVADINAAAANCQRVINRIEPKVFDSIRRKQFKDLAEAVETYIKQAVIIGMYTGAINEDGRFMELLDEVKKNGSGHPEKE